MKEKTFTIFFQIIKDIKNNFNFNLFIYLNNTFIENKFLKKIVFIYEFINIILFLKTIKNYFLKAESNLFLRLGPLSGTSN